MRLARRVTNDVKNYICPNYQFVCYAELEIHLNSYLTNPFERWLLYFEEISLPPGCNLHLNDRQTVQTFDFPPNKFIIYHNSKMKYFCDNCGNRWTTARGRTIFQSEYPQKDKYNFLYLHVSTQQCRFCHRIIQPLWYLHEATRVMKSICRIFRERFYSDRVFVLPPSSSSSSSEEEKELQQQRGNRATGQHQRDLCSACRHGYCFDSHRQHR